MAAAAVVEDCAKYLAIVAAEGHSGIDLIETARHQYQFAFVVSLKSGAGNDVDDAIGAIAELGAVAAAVGLEVVNILGINLRTEGGGDVCIRYRDTIEQPGDLVPAAQVQHVVREVGTGWEYP